MTGSPLAAAPRPRVLALLLAALLAPPPVPAADEAGGVLRFTAERQGIRVEARIEPLGGGLEEGGSARVALRFADTSAGAPLSGLYPAAWMDRLPAERREEASDCRKKVETFLGGGLLARPEVDLNAFHVVTLNDDPSLSVVDPLFGFGGSKLLTLVALDAPGEDWVLGPGGGTLYVSMPDAGRVAAVDTATWRVAARWEVGGRPGRLALQPDGRYLWVGVEGGPEGSGFSGVAAIDPAAGAVAGHFATGPGPHHLAASDDDRWLLVAGGGEGRVSVIDVRELRVARRIPVGGQPEGIAWSAAAGSAWVPLREGEVAVVDPERPEPVARIAAEPGLGRLAFAPGERYALVVNPERGRLHVVDAAARRLHATLELDGAPDQLAFTDAHAYVRHAASDRVALIPLVTLGGEPSVVEIAGGRLAPGAEARPSPAPALVPAPGAAAMLIANPADGAVYYYKEGMAAPMGSFNNYGRLPRAVQVVDRSLREGAPGEYTTVAPLARSGAYDLVLFVASPPAVHCFPFDVAHNPELERRRRAGRFRLALEGEPPALVPGREVELHFHLLEADGGRAREGLTDLSVLTFLAPGVWQRRQAAEPASEGGYRVRFTPPGEGLYYLFLESRASGLDLGRSPFLTLEAEDGEDGGREGSSRAGAQRRAES